MITISIMLANIMQGVDNTILNVALPHIQGSLSASLDQIAWALTSYIVCAAIMMPLTGWLAGRFGIKHIFLISVIGFTLASALCGAATSLGELVLFRALQGVAGAGLIPLSQATLLQINPPERHGHAMAVFGIGTILGPIMGPALGGWLTYDYSWRWIFYINLPVGVLCTLGILVFIRQTRNVHREPFDFVGFLTLSSAECTLAHQFTTLRPHSLRLAPGQELVTRRAIATWPFLKSEPSKSGSHETPPPEEAGFEPSVPP
jgi:DHA2 family multidrug resistance protein